MKSQNDSESSPTEVAVTSLTLLGQSSIPVQIGLGTRYTYRIQLPDPFERDDGYELGNDTNTPLEHLATPSDDA